MTFRLPKHLVSEQVSETKCLGRKSCLQNRKINIKNLRQEVFSSIFNMVNENFQEFLTVCLAKFQAKYTNTV